MKLTKTVVMGITAATLAFSAMLQAAEVNITPTLESVTVIHGDKNVKIMRNQNQKNTVNPAFAKTSRKCPPFCIQPSSLAPGVETIGELEVLNYLKLISEGDQSILVIDSRTPDWVSKGTIPGAINIPWKSLNPGQGADPISIGGILEERLNANLAVRTARPDNTQRPQIPRPYRAQKLQRSFVLPPRIQALRP